jgi:SPP1 family predicted phage head-tail adaptor
MRILADKLDRRITILERLVTKDPLYRTDVVTWGPGATVCAEVQDMLPSHADRVAEGISLASRPALVRIRWRDDVSQANRIEIDGKQMRIVSGPAMVGRREGLEIMVEELTTEGQEP